jgi:outer membrane receptor protein involved in Fe transport
MKVSKGLVSFTGRLLCGAAVGAIAATAASAQSISDEIVVTAQRQEQSLQDVPIAVSAFNGDDLAARQLETFQDIQFNIPNFAFSKSQFTASSISIRGIGALAVGSSTEPSTSIHMNDFYLNAPRLFETEFFDIERLEILRGPQGTLFGRNATGGVVNVITKKASTDGVQGYADAEYGNYNAVKVQGALNLPLSDRLAVRIAGTTIQRDGYTTNVTDGRDIDDRNIYALRGSARWEPSDNTTFDFTASYMREDDSRTRSQKQACEAGPLQPLLGCDPNGPRSFDPQDLRATFFANTSAETFGLATGNPAAAAYGLFSLAGGPVFGVAQPTDLRQVAIDTRPQYAAEESIFILNMKHDFESWSFKLNGGWGNSKVASRQDFDGGIGPQLTRPAALCAPLAFGGLPALCNLTGGAAGPVTFPLSQFDVGITSENNGLIGVAGGHIQDRSSNYRAVDYSVGETDYWSVEGIVNTDFDGRVNFLVGVSHAESNGYADYGVATTGLDYFAYTLGTLSAVGAAPDPLAAAGAASTGFSLYTPFFWNDTDDNFLDSTSAFGEIYVDISDTLKLTGGIRHNWDTKGLRDRGNLLESASSTNAGVLAGTPPIVPFGTPSVRPLLDPDEFTQGTPGAVNDFRVTEDNFNATTGRAVLQWTPNDDVQLYASWTRGYKPGGFNPRTSSASVPLTFEPEVIKAYEAGIKSNLGGGLQANLTGFYYDYSGLQVSRIVANTSVNDNINAKVYGVEGEFIWRPTDRLTANMNASYLHTKIGDFATIDVRNPTAGATAGATLLADITNGSNCVLLQNGAPFNPINPAVTLASISPALAGASPALAAGFDALTASPFTVCSSLQGLFNTAQLPLGPMGALISLNQALGTDFQVVDGLATTVTGNELPGSPNFKIAGGLQYEMPVGANHTLTPRVDAYYQNDMYTNIFNTEQDLVEGYAYVNAQVKFGPTDGNWSMRFFMQNVTNNDAVTGAFDVGQGAGNFQNLFLLEPRRWGFGLNMNF